MKCTYRRDIFEQILAKQVILSEQLHNKVIRGVTLYEEMSAEERTHFSWQPRRKLHHNAMSVHVAHIRKQHLQVRLRKEIKHQLIHQNAISEVLNGESAEEMRLEVDWMRKQWKKRTWYTKYGNWTKIHLLSQTKNSNLSQSTDVLPSTKLHDKEMVEAEYFLLLFFSWVIFSSHQQTQLWGILSHLCQNLSLQVEIGHEKLYHLSFSQKHIVQWKQEKMWFAKQANSSCLSKDEILVFLSKSLPA